MSLLLKQERNIMQETLKNETIRFFLTQDNLFLETLESFISLDY
jgi:hypothetical protein